MNVLRCVASGELHQQCQGALAVHEITGRVIQAFLSAFYLVLAIRMGGRISLGL